ncbi:acyl carrier protein [Marivita geojedonensis]|nr:acyl carrier protein [Marivita geojedonensis]
MTERFDPVPTNRQTAYLRHGSKTHRSCTRLFIGRLSIPSPTPEALLAEALGLDPSTIGPETALETSAAWDSLAHFRIVAAIEETLARPLTPDEIFSATDYQSIGALLTTGTAAQD